MLKSDFYNEPLTDFSRPENRQAMLDALQLVQSQLGKEYSLLIGGEAIHTDRKVVSINPSKTSEVVGLASKANASQAVSAIEAAAKAFGSWRRVPAEKRAEYLFQSAHLMRARKHEFAAWMVYEVGKNWAEADGDVAEAIDFM
jgi:1-pyrroline-5-carboxylate dehydrogenase